MGDDAGLGTERELRGADSVSVARVERVTGGRPAGAAGGPAYAVKPQGGS